MHAFRTLLTLVACSLVSVSAVPLHRHHRRTCRTHSAASQLPTSVAVSESAALPTEVPTSTAESTFSALPTSTAKAESTTKKATSTNAPSSTHESSSSHKATSTSKEPASTPTKSSDDGDDDDSSATTGLLKKLFPVNALKKWTTSTSSDDSLPLNDNTFGVTKLLSALSHDYVTAPDGKKSVQAHYPEGSYTFGHSPEGGFSFYATGPDNFNLDNAKEATLSYSVYFEEDFDFNKGGKLPGFCECQLSKRFLLF